MEKVNFKKHFALLKNKNLIYFDNCASTLKPNCVINAVTNYYKHTPVNVGRGVYKLAYDTTQQVNAVRETIASFIGANPSEVIFTKNTTEALNLVAQSFGNMVLTKDSEILYSILEHHSNYLPWVQVANQVGSKMVNIPLTSDHKITLANFKKAFTKNTKIVLLTHVSNVLGYVSPLKQLIIYAHKMGAYVVVDGAQSLSHFSVNVADLDADFYAFSGYKMFGPTGVGVLYGKQELLYKMPPIMFGGGMIQDVSKNIEFKQAPDKFEAGTLPVAQIIGLVQAVNFIRQIGYDYITKQDETLKNYLINKLSELKQVAIYSTNPDVSIISFNILGVHAHDVATMYDQFGICVRAGHHCNQPLTEYLGQVATVRVSLAFYNTTAQIDKFIVATQKIIDFFSKFN